MGYFLGYKPLECSMQNPDASGPGRQHSTLKATKRDFFPLLLHQVASVPQRYVRQLRLAAAQRGKARPFRKQFLTPLPEAQPQEDSLAGTQRKATGIPHCAAASRNQILLAL